MKMRFKNIIIMAAVAGLGGAEGLAQQSGGEALYRLDPGHSVVQPQAAATSSGPQVVVDKDKELPSVRLQTGTPIEPYLGTARQPELSPEERRLLGKEQDRGPLSAYHLEAGVGLLLEDKASVSLGYRFHERPSLLEDRRNDPLALSGDLRLSFDVKMPF